MFSTVFKDFLDQGYFPHKDAVKLLLFLLLATQYFAAHLEISGVPSDPLNLTRSWIWDDILYISMSDSIDSIQEVGSDLLQLWLIPYHNFFKDILPEELIGLLGRIFKKNQLTM